jgi:hypothetical protein
MFFLQLPKFSPIIVCGKTLALLKSSTKTAKAPLKTASDKIWYDLLNGLTLNPDIVELLNSPRFEKRGF